MRWYRGEEVWEGFMEEVILDHKWYIRIYLAEGRVGRGEHSRQLDQHMLRYGNEKGHGML